MRFHAAVADTVLRIATPTTAGLVSKTCSTIMETPSALDDAIAGGALAAVLAARIRAFLSEPADRGGATFIATFGTELVLSTGDWKKDASAAGWFELTGMSDASPRNITRLLTKYCTKERQAAPPRFAAILMHAPPLPQRVTPAEIMEMGSGPQAWPFRIDGTAVPTSAETPTNDEY
jgi:hypothetical protein